MASSRISNSLPPEFNYSVNKFYKSLLECRPLNPIDFAAQFFHDEVLPNSEVLHAIHSLQYLINFPERFKEKVSTIYTYELSKGPISGLTVQSILQDMNRRNKLDITDSSQFADIINQISKDLIVNYDNVSFEEFFVAIQLPALCNSLIQWIRGVVTSCNRDIRSRADKETHSNDAHAPLEPRATVDLDTVDLIPLIRFVKCMGHHSPSPTHSSQSPGKPLGITTTIGGSFHSLSAVLLAGKSSPSPSRLSTSSMTQAMNKQSTFGTSQSLLSTVGAPSISSINTSGSTGGGGSSSSGREPGTSVTEVDRVRLLAVLQMLLERIHPSTAGAGAGSAGGQYVGLRRDELRERDRNTEVHVKVICSEFLTNVMREAATSRRTEDT